MNTNQRTGIPRRSPIKTTGNKRTNRPSLVVLGPDDQQTSFQRRKYNPKEFPDLNPKRFQTNIANNGSQGFDDDKSSSDELYDDNFNINWNNAPGSQKSPNTPGIKNSPSNIKNGNDNDNKNKYLINDNDNDDDDDLNNDNLANNKDDNNSNGDDDGYDGNNDNDNDDNNNNDNNEPAEPELPDDARSNATSAYSEYLGDDATYQKLIKQLDLDPKLFPKEFEDMDLTYKRQLARLGRLQIVKKRNWFNQVWTLFDDPPPEDIEDPSLTSNKLWTTLRIFNLLENPDFNPDESDIDIKAFTDDPLAKCLLKAAQETLNQFVISDNGGLNLYMKAAVMGPAGSGKSVYLRFIFNRLLNFLVEGGRYKNFFIIPFDFEKHQVSSIEEFYQYISGVVVESLIIQRPDLQLFESSLRKAFSTLTKVVKMKHLPKPISSQDYLRQSMKEVERVLLRMHACYNDPKLIDSFLTNIVLLPQVIGQIFKFETPLLVIDHIDAVDIEIKRKGQPSIQLLEFIKFGLTHTQYLISCSEGQTFSEKLSALDEDSVDIRNNTQNIYVYDTVLSKFEDRNILITFEKSSPQRTIVLSASHCGGCPLFVGRYDHVCTQLISFNTSKSKIEKSEIKVQLMKNVAAYIEDMYDYDQLPDIDGIEFVDNKENLNDYDYDYENDDNYNK